MNTAIIWLLVIGVACFLLRLYFLHDLEVTKHGGTDGDMGEGFFIFVLGWVAYALWALALLLYLLQHVRTGWV